MGHHHLCIFYNNMHTYRRIPSLTDYLSLQLKDVCMACSKYVQLFLTDFILSYMYMIVEATVLPAGPNKFSHSKEIITAFNMILGLQVSSMTLKYNIT